MFQVTKKKIVNEVTKEINKGTTLEELLLNKDIPNSVLYEPEEFIDFLFPPDEMSKPKPKLSNLDKLIKLSLDPGEEFDKEKLYQKNRNAASILSSASVKIHEKLREDNSKRFFKKLRRFIIKSKYNQNIMFVGHFQRMFEAALLKSRGELLDESYNDGFEQKFLPFIIKNSRLLPYRELLSKIISEYSEYFPGCIEETLRFAAISTLHIIETPNKTKNSNKIIPANQLQKTSLQELIDDQPVNCHHEKIPIPYFMNTELNISESDSKSEDDAAFIDGLKKELKYNDLKDTDVSSDTQKNDNPWIKYALNLIYAVKNGYESCTKNVMRKKIDKDTNDKKESLIVKYLLICGMYADSNSSLSYTSFNLLFNLLNQQHTDSDDLFDGKYILNLNPPKIVDEYAEHFKFNQYDVSEKMISALLVFWNHPYTKIEGSKIKTDVKKLVPGYKSRGITPLQYLLPTILTEPVYSCKLNNIFMRIISSMEQEIIDTIDKERKIRNDQAQKDFKEIEKKCFKYDSIWFDLLTYKFKLLPNDKKETILQNALERMLSLPTTDDFYQNLITSDSEDIYKFYRAPTNPVIFMLSKSINHGPFFSFKKGIEFRKALKEPFSKEWIQQTFTYCHIVDRMEKQLINIPYEKSRKKHLKIDKYASNDEMDLQSQYADKLTDSLRFKSGKK